MPLPVSYMGTKRQLAHFVGEVADLSPPGPLLDVFSGMCAVASAIAPRRQIWTNDLQHFARSVSEAHFCSQYAPPSRFDAAAITMKAYSAHVGFHTAVGKDRLKAEQAALDARDSKALNEAYASWQALPALPKRSGIAGMDAVLFRDTFAGSYFGLSQSIEIDAIRYALDDACANDVINRDQHRWLIIALCVALSKTSTSTGHFAQPLTAKQSTISRFKKQRQRSIREEWLSAVGNLKSVGSATWRAGNRAYLGEALATLGSLHNDFIHPAVVYADPPYTNDQYSRYYHVYDTLVRYDYPDATGRGRYRSDRAVSSFSLASSVAASIDDLVNKCSILGSDLIISYPTAGLLKDSRDQIPSMIFKHFGRYPTVHEIAHRHSTMGGSKGTGKQDVTEVIYRAFH